MTRTVFGSKLHHPVAWLSALSLVVSSCSAPSPAQVPAALPPGTVIDNFDGPAGAPPNPALWGYDTGPWLDDGLQTYTSSPDNVRLDGDGHLLIQARRTSDGYTSARPNTRGKLAMRYGTVSARIKMPSGQGIWPAFWMMGADFHPDHPETWPGCGEIDMMELVNDGNSYHVTLHGPQGDTDYYGGVKVTDKVVGTSGPIPDLTADFHNYWLKWKPDHISIGVDERTLGTFTPKSLPPGADWVFNRSMFVLFDIAVGGPWPGPPDASTPWPATMAVDWFRYDPSD